MARWEGRGRFRNGRPSSNVRVADETHSSGRRFELRCLTDAANAQAQSRAAPSLKRHYWIMPRFDQQPAKRQYWRGAARRHPERGATIRTDQFGKNGLRFFSWEAISPSARAAKLGQFGNAARLVCRGVSILQHVLHGPDLALVRCRFKKCGLDALNHPAGAVFAAASNPYWEFPTIGRMGEVVIPAPGRHVRNAAQLAAHLR